MESFPDSLNMAGHLIQGSGPPSEDKSVIVGGMRAFGVSAAMIRLGYMFGCVCVGGSVPACLRQLVVDY